MSRGSVRCLSLLVCVCFTLSMLFSNTLQVEAAQIVKTVSYSFNITLDPSTIVESSNGGTLTITGVTGTSTSQSLSLSSSGNYNGDEGGTGSTQSSTGRIAYTGVEVGRISLSESGSASSQAVYMNDITGTITSNVTDSKSTFQFDYDIPFYIVDSDYLFSNFDSSKKYGAVSVYIQSSSVNKGYLNNVDIKFEGNSARYNQYFYKGQHIHSNCLAPLLNCTGSLSFATTGSSTQTFNVTYTFTYVVSDALDSEVGTLVNNPVENNQLNDLNTSTDNIEQSVTSDTGGGLLATIKNFFGSFFQNVFDTLVSVFVPEDGFFSDWFNRLNTLLSEKLGMLYAPFDLLVTTLNAIMNADTTDTGIPFPGIQWEDTYLVEPFTFYFSSLGDTFTDLQRYVYFATDTVLLFAFLYLLQNKIRLILEGHESG